MSQNLGHTLSIVGGLVVGQAAGQQLVEQGEAGHLDNTGTGGKQNKFYCADQLGFHKITSGSF